MSLFQNADTELESIIEALLARVVDTDLGVLEALYNQADEGSGFADVVLSRNAYASRYVELVSGVLFPVVSTEAVKPPKRAILKVHLSFVINNLASTSPNWDVDSTNNVFHRLVFPYLLYSKPRGKSADAVWDLLKKGEIMHPWIAGWETNMGLVDDDKDDTERMQALNVELARMIAGTFRTWFFFACPNLSRCSEHQLVTKCRSYRTHSQAS